MWPDGVVRLAEGTTGEVVNEFDLPNLGGAVLSPDGRRVALDGRVLDARSGEEDFVLDGEFEWADPYVWSPDGKWIAAGDRRAVPEQRVLVWDATTGERHVTVPTDPVTLEWSPDGTRIATSGHDGTTRVWEIDVGSARELFSFSTQDLSTGGGLAFSPDGDRLMVGDEAITAVKVYDLSIAGGARMGERARRSSRPARCGVIHARRSSARHQQRGRERPCCGTPSAETARGCSGPGASLCASR